MTELVAFGESALRLSAPGRTRLETSSRADLYVDGVESTVAVAASRLGVASTWLSKLPDTPVGRRVVADLHRHGIETDVAWTDEGRVGLVYHEAAAEPRETGRWHDREGTSAALATQADLPMDRVRSADVVVSGATTPSLSEDAAEATEAVMRAGGGAGALCALAMDYDPALAEADFLGRLLERLLGHVDVLAAEESEARTVFDLTGKPRELANTLVAEYDLEMALVSRSQGGAVVLHDTPGTNVIHERDPLESAAVDPSGGQAALVGGFLARIADGADAAEALTHGVAAGSLAQSMPGPLLTATESEIEAAATEVSGGA